MYTLLEFIFKHRYDAFFICRLYSCPWILFRFILFIPLLKIPAENHNVVKSMEKCLYLVVSYFPRKKFNNIFYAFLQILIFRDLDLEHLSADIKYLLHIWYCLGVSDVILRFLREVTPYLFGQGQCMSLYVSCKQWCQTVMLGVIGVCQRILKH